MFSPVWILNWNPCSAAFLYRQVGLHLHPYSLWKVVRDGAHVSSLSKFLHPSEHIRAKYVNPVKGQRLGGLGVVLQEEK